MIEMPDETAATAAARIRREPAPPPPDLGLVARLGAKARSYADRLKSAERERDELRAARDAAEAELTTLRAKADPSAAAARADALAAELRTIKHRAVFDRLAAEAGVDPAAVDSVYQLSGYKPEADEPDPAAITTALEAQKARLPQLFGPPAGAASGTAEGGAGTAVGTPTTTPALPPGPGLHRRPAQQPPQRFTDAQLSDPVFCMTHYQAIAEAAMAKVASGA